MTNITNFGGKRWIVLFPLTLLIIAGCDLFGDGSIAGTYTAVSYNGAPIPTTFLSDITTTCDGDGTEVVELTASTLILEEGLQFSLEITLRSFCANSGTQTDMETRSYFGTYRVEGNLLYTSIVIDGIREEGSGTISGSRITLGGIEYERE